MTTPSEWAKLYRERRGAYAVACELQRQLIGYRQTSLKRADDVDNITSALQGVMIVATEEAIHEIAATTRKGN